MPQKQYRPHYEHLKNKWIEKHREIQKIVWEKHRESLQWLQGKAHHLATGALSGLLLVATPQAAAIPLNQANAVLYPQEFEGKDKSVFLITDLSNLVPGVVRPLHQEEEERIGRALSARFGIPVSAELDGKRLNRSYGYIGAEQHLMRYPGDTMATHFQTQEESIAYGRSGMAPGRGAWGYFARSASEMSQKDIDREKYYIAVQTFLSPGYMQNVAQRYQWFKYRKMLVVNPQNGKAVVAVIGDAGPAQWTGKHLGGSPEVMKDLERVDGKQKGPVLYFFVNDPDDTIPLGPIEVK